jgi:hypothetical protein
MYLESVPVKICTEWENYLETPWEKQPITNREHKSHIFKESPTNIKIHTFKPSVCSAEGDIPDRRSENETSTTIYHHKGIP